MCRDLARMFREEAAHQDTRAIVLTGTGVAFSAGADLKELLAARDAGDMTGFIRDAQDITRAMHACPKPIVVAINGFAVGMGLELSLGADYRIASRNAVFALPERQHKLEVTNAASWLLPQRIGTVAAEELITSGRKFDASEALHLGIIEPRSRPQRAALVDFSIILMLAVPVFILVAVSSEIAAAVFDQASPGVLNMVGIAMVGGFLATLAGIAVAYYGTVATYRFGLDPDNYGVPLLTASMDLVGAFSLIAAIALLRVA